MASRIFICLPPSGSRSGQPADRLLPLAIGTYAHDVPGKPESLQPADEQASGIEFAPAQAVEGRGRKRVVVVVPGLAEGQERQPAHVCRLVVSCEATPAEEVADRIDAEGRVME